jgi:thymidine kinase
VIICNECKKQSLIAHYLKYFIKSNGKIVLGGNDVVGPLCQDCWFDVGDQALGKPTMLKKEQDK